MQPIRIGTFEINRIADYQGPFFDPPDFFPDFDPEVVRANAELLGPRLLEPGTGKLIFSFHSFVVRTGHHTILIDSCIGNDKERPTRPQFHRMRTSFIDDDYALDNGLWFEPYPGHTPGNVVIHARSGGERGVFIGDVLHHPLQCLKPEWSTMACTDPGRSRVSRTRLVEEHADNGTLVLP